MQYQYISRTFPVLSLKSGFFFFKNSNSNKKTKKRKKKKDDLHTPPSKAGLKHGTKKKYTAGLRSKDLTVSHVSVAINVCKCNVFLHIVGALNALCAYIYIHIAIQYVTMYLVTLVFFFSSNMRTRKSEWKLRKTCRLPRNM